MPDSFGASSNPGATLHGSIAPRKALCRWQIAPSNCRRWDVAKSMLCHSRGRCWLRVVADWKSLDRRRTQDDLMSLPSAKC